MKNHFIPKRDGDLDAYEENFSNKITIHAVTLGIDPSEVTAVKTSIANHRLSYSNMNSKRAESKASSEDNLIKKEHAVNEIRRISKMIKSFKNYTPAIGDDLGIIGADKPVKDIAELKPVLTPKIVGQEIVIKFQKEGTDGIKIYSKRGAETEFTFLAVDTQSPYNDNRPKLESSKPEQREYYAYYFEVDSEIGKQSDVIKVTLP